MKKYFWCDTPKICASGVFQLDISLHTLIAEMNWKYVRVVFSEASPSVCVTMLIHDDEKTHDSSISTSAT